MFRLIQCLATGDRGQSQQATDDVRSHQLRASGIRCGNSIRRRQRYRSKCRYIVCRDVVLPV